jgi:hypothetical protein
MKAPKKGLPRDVDWFSRGRDAFNDGKPCSIHDARLRSDQRHAWRRGWNHQARLNNRLQITDAERAELVAEIKEIADSIRTPKA